MDIRIDADLCINSGQCARLIPTVFAQDADGGGVVVGAPMTTQEAAVRAVAAACPGYAIEIVDRT
jgi:ferredoxin